MDGYVTTDQDIQPVVDNAEARIGAYYAHGCNQAMNPDAFDVLEIFLASRWNIKKPVRTKSCLILG